MSIEILMEEIELVVLKKIEFECQEQSDKYSNYGNFGSSGFRWNEKSKTSFGKIAVDKKKTVDWPPANKCSL